MENAQAEGGGTDSTLITEQVRQGTQQVVQGTQQAVNQVAEGAKQQAQSLLDRQKGQATQTLHQVHTALSQTGRNLRDQNQGAAAGLIEGAASKMDDFCRYLESRDTGQLLGEVEDFARSNAAIVLGGAVAAGVLLARFLKSSTPRSSSWPADYGGRYQQPGSYGDYSGYPMRGTYGSVPEATGTYPPNTPGYPATGKSTFTTDTDQGVELDPMGVTDGPAV
jgi:hypothetical protein